MSEKIKQLSLAEKIYHRLLEQIINGKLREGAKLSEESICRDLGVSRTPAREALMMLDRDNWWIASRDADALSENSSMKKLVNWLNVVKCWNACFWNMALIIFKKVNY